MQAKNSALDVAQYILKKQGPITAMKLQKLVYYSQAWSLVWDERPLFKERIEAWVNGPVVPELYEAHRGMFEVHEIPGGLPDTLDEAAKETIDEVLNHYGDKSSQWLSDLTHKERPWREAREGIPDNQRSQIEITPASMAEYYDSL